MRLINAANARIMSIVLKGSDVWLAALDGHPVTPLRLAGHPLDLAPGQRADLILPQSQDPVAIVNQMGGEPLEIASIIRTGRTGGDDVGGPPPASAGSPRRPAMAARCSRRRSGSRAVPAAVCRARAMADAA